MADNVMESNLSSPFVLKNTAKNEVELVTYGHRKNTGISTIKYQKLTNLLDVAGAATALTGYTCDMEVNKAGRLRSMLVKVWFTVSGGTYTSTASGMAGFGKRVAASVVVGTPEHELYRQTAYSFPAKFSRLNPAQKAWVNEKTQVYNALTDMPHSGILVTHAGGSTLENMYYTYIPVLGPWMHGDRMNWDLQKLEPIRVFVTLSSNKIEMGFGTTVVPALAVGKKIEIFAEYITYEPEYKQALYLSNFGAPPGPGDSPKWMTYTSYTTNSQKFSIPTGATTGTTIRVPFKSPCANFSIFMPKQTVAGALVNGRQPNLKIRSIKLIPDSNSYIEGVPPDVLATGLSSQNGPNIEMLENGTSRVALDENCVDIGFCSRANDLTSFSGCLAYNGIKDMSIELTYADSAGAAITVTDYAIVYGQVHYCELLMNGMDGDFSATISG